MLTITFSIRTKTVASKVAVNGKSILEQGREFRHSRNIIR